MFRVGVFRALPEILAQSGCDAGQFLQEAGVTDRALCDPELRLSLTDGFRLLAHCARRTGKSDLGILLGRAFKPEDLGMLGELAITAPTLRALIACLVDNADLQDDGSIVILHEDGAHSSLYHCMQSSAITMPSIVTDLCTALCCRLIRSVCGEDWHPAAVYLQTRKPPRHTAYNDFFRCQVFFDSPHCEMSFPTADLVRANPLSDPVGHARLQKDATTIRQQICIQDMLCKALPRTIRRGLLTGAFRAEDIARSIGLHERTLHRRLADLGTNYREQLSDTRHAFAVQLLTGTRLPVYEIAMALGYADTPAFVRAFHRRNGTSPRRWLDILESAADPEGMSTRRSNARVSGPRP